MYSSVFEIKTAQGSAVIYNERCVICTHSDIRAQRKKTVFLRDIICVEQSERTVIIGTACGKAEICFESILDADRFEEQLVSRICDTKRGPQMGQASTEEKMRMGEDEFAAALFGDELLSEANKAGESPADFLARLADAEADEIISVLQDGRQNFTDAELERIEAALVMKMEM